MNTTSEVASAQGVDGGQAALDSGGIPISEAFDLGKFSIDFYALVPGSEVSA